MTILELLKSEETPCWVQGFHTRIIRNISDGTFEVLQRKETKKKGSFGDYAVQLYHGISEEDAVTAFVIGESL